MGRRRLHCLRRLHGLRRIHGRRHRRGPCLVNPVNHH